MRVAQFLLKVVQDLEVRDRLHSARTRESALHQCVEEVPRPEVEEKQGRSNGLSEREYRHRWSELSCRQGYAPSP